MRIEFHKLDMEANEYDYLKSVYGQSMEWKDDLGAHLYLDHHAFILTADEHAEIVSAHNSIVKLMHRMLDILHQDVRLNDWLGVPEALWKESMKKRISTLTAYGRFDWMFDVKGDLNLLEFNAETPMGWKEAILWTIRLHKEFPKYACENLSLSYLLAESIKRSLKEQGVPENARLCIVGDLCDAEELETFELLKSRIDYPVAAVHIGSIHNLKLYEGFDQLKDGLYLQEGDLLYPIDVLQTFYSLEWLAYDTDIYENNVRVGNRLERFINDGTVKCVNPVSTLQLHSKGLFALIWFLTNTTELLDEFKETIYAYIPYTTFDIADCAELEYDQIVQKPLNEREGSNVFVQSLEEGVRDSALKEGVIYQEYIDSGIVLYPRADQTLKRHFIEMKPTIGTYVVNDRFGGYFTRLSEGICSNKDATFVPTFIESII